MNPPENHKQACEECLTHAWQISHLGAWIQNKVDAGGNTTFDLLKLDMPELLTELEVSADVVKAPELGEMWAAIEERELTAICRHSERYPEQLNDLTAPPKVLFCAGNTGLLADFDRDQMVAIVGARKATGYGLEIAAKLGRGFARDEVAVVSGMALGIDGAAHRGALEHGNTIAVLPCGADRPYPASHTRLYQKIRDRGLVVSEAIPGADAWRWSFPARNRIIAALSGNTVVVEAAWRSGSLITAKLADQLDRGIFAVPGPLTSGAAAGPNTLIKQGLAHLIETAADVPAKRRSTSENKEGNR